MRRNWVKLWVNEWLDGTTRYQMSGAQRAFWIDLMAMAGRSRQPGIVCSGKDGDHFVGYPLTHFQALDAGQEIDVLVTFKLFEDTNKITVEVTSEMPIKLYKVTILNWEKYQSEYGRQKAYRGGFADGYRRKGPKVTKQVTADSGAKLRAKLQPTLLTEGEVEGEVELKTKSCASNHSLHDTNDPSRRVERDIIARVFDHYLARTLKNPKVNKLTPLRQNKGRARLEEALEMAGKDYVKAEGLLILAVDAFTSSDWHMGRDPKTNGKKYDSWEKHLFPNAEKFEYWIQQPERVEATA